MLKTFKRILEFLLGYILARLRTSPRFLIQIFDHAAKTYEQTTKIKRKT